MARISRARSTTDVCIVTPESRRLPFSDLCCSLSQGISSSSLLAGVMQPRRGRAVSLTVGYQLAGIYRRHALPAAGQTAGHIVQCIARYQRTERSRGWTCQTSNVCGDNNTACMRPHDHALRAATV